MFTKTATRKVASANGKYPKDISRVINQTTATSVAIRNAKRMMPGPIFIEVTPLVFKVFWNAPSDTLAPLNICLGGKLRKGRGKYPGPLLEIILLLDYSFD